MNPATCANADKTGFKKRNLSLMRMPSLAGTLLTTPFFVRGVKSYTIGVEDQFFSVKTNSK